MSTNTFSFPRFFNFRLSILPYDTTITKNNKI